VLELSNSFEGNFLRSFALFSDAGDKHHVCSETAIEWTGPAKSVYQQHPLKIAKILY
jgi:hypothetical protein